MLTVNSKSLRSLEVYFLKIIIMMIPCLYNITQIQDAFILYLS